MEPVTETQETPIQQDAPEPQTQEPVRPETPEKKRGGAFLMVFGVLFIAAAVALVLYNRIQDANAGDEAALILSKLERATSFSQLQMPDAEMPMISIDGKDYIGKLVIEREGKDPVELPIMAFWDDKDGWTAPGRYSGSAYDDTMVLCGHNMPSHFSILLELNEGDRVTFTDVNGNVFLYKVVQLYNLKPTQVADMITGEWDLTLFTCTLAGNERMTVRCMRVEE